jgi:hypothetical protein
LLQELPVFTAPIAEWVIEVPKKKRETAIVNIFFMTKRLLSHIRFVFTPSVRGKDSTPTGHCPLGES